MPYNTKKLLTDVEGKPIPQQYDSATDTFKPFQQMEFYGATVTSRPSVSSVPVGAVYCAVQTQEFWQSDGTQWVVV